MNSNFDPLAALQSIGSARGWNGPMFLDVGSLPYVVPSYSIAGEDMALRKIFKHKLTKRLPGTFIDIGCSNPIEASNSYLFYAYGWRGVCVDAIDKSAFYRQSRPEDTFIQAALGFEGDVFLHRHSVTQGQSKITTSQASPGPDFRADTIRLQGMSLDALIDKTLRDKPIDFMSIDVEGAELAILRSKTWDTRRPSVILMECHDFSFTAMPETVRFLQERGYELQEKIGANVIMASTA